MLAAVPGAAAAQPPDVGAAGPLGLGRAATAEEIAALDIDVRPDGDGLPLGGGTVADGARVWDRACRACHGAEGEGGIAAPVVGRDPAAPPAHRRQLLAVRHDPLRLHLPRDAGQRPRDADPGRGVRARRLDPEPERHHRRPGGDERRHAARRGDARARPVRAGRPPGERRRCAEPSRAGGAGTGRTTAWRATRCAEPSRAGGAGTGGKIGARATRCAEPSRVHGRPRHGDRRAHRPAPEDGARPAVSRIHR